MVSRNRHTRENAPTFPHSYDYGRNASTTNQCSAVAGVEHTNPLCRSRVVVIFGRRTRPRVVMTDLLLLLSHPHTHSGEASISVPTHSLKNNKTLHISVGIGGFVRGSRAELGVWRVCLGNVYPLRLVLSRPSVKTKELSLILFQYYILLLLLFVIIITPGNAATPPSRNPGIQTDSGR